MIIDFHAHIKRDPVTKQYFVDELMADMDENNIDLRVISAMEGSSIAAQNSFVSSLVTQYQDRFVGFAVINPKADDSVEEARRAAQLPGIRGFEFNSFEHGYFPENCANIDAILDVAEEFHLSVKMFTGVGAMTMPQQWAIYAKKHPNVMFVMLHMGCFDFGYSCVDLAKEYDNIMVETSNQYEVQIFNKAFSVLPAEKFLFGSQYPNKITHCSMDTFEMFHLSDEFKEKLFCQNAKRLLGL